MGKPVHRLSNVDPDARAADCAKCGRIEVCWNGRRWRCRTAKKESRHGEKSRDHGLTRAEAESLKDGATCAICGSGESLKVDHDHHDGRIRGVLCHNCNIAVGHMRDDPVRLRAAADYLER